MTDFGDLSAAELALAGGGTVTVAAFLFLVLQAVKDFWPSLGGRAALIVLYVLSLLIAGALTAQTDPDWQDYTTYLAFVVVTISVSIVAKGIYSQLFHVAVAGIPPSPDAHVPPDAVHDPQAESLPPAAGGYRR